MLMILTANSSTATATSSGDDDDDDSDRQRYSDDDDVADDTNNSQKARTRGDNDIFCANMAHIAFFKCTRKHTHVTHTQAHTNGRQRVHKAAKEVLVM